MVSETAWHYRQLLFGQPIKCRTPSPILTSKSRKEDNNFLFCFSQAEEIGNENDNRSITSDYNSAVEVFTSRMEVFLRHIALTINLTLKHIQPHLKAEILINCYFIICSYNVNWIANAYCIIP